MIRILFLDPIELEQVEPLNIAPPDPVLVDVVDKAISKLPDHLRQLTVQKISMGMSAQQIADINGQTKKQVVAALYEAKRLLKTHLSDFVLKRWNIKVRGRCRICEHPKRNIIEKMLLAKRRSETWGSFNKRLRERIGERFTPPKILIAHCNHIKNENGGIDENR
jgi:hypothetical protein